MDELLFSLCETDDGDVAPAFSVLSQSQLESAKLQEPLPPHTVKHKAVLLSGDAAISVIILPKAPAYITMEEKMVNQSGHRSFRPGRQNRD